MIQLVNMAAKNDAILGRFKLFQQLLEKERFRAVVDLPNMTHDASCRSHCNDLAYLIQQNEKVLFVSCRGNGFEKKVFILNLPYVRTYATLSHLDNNNYH